MTSCARSPSTCSTKSRCSGGWARCSMPSRSRSATARRCSRGSCATPRSNRGLSTPDDRVGAGVAVAVAVVVEQDTAHTEQMAWLLEQSRRQADQLADLLDQVRVLLSARERPDRAHHLAHVAHRRDDHWSGCEGRGVIACVPPLVTRLTRPGTSCRLSHTSAVRG
jgi:hypothetical protein